MKAYIQFSKKNITYPMLNKYIEFNTKKQLINKIRKSQTKDNLRRFFGSYTSINIDFIEIIKGFCATCGILLVLYILGIIFC